jgi:hypothetical protein
VIAASLIIVGIVAIGYGTAMTVTGVDPYLGSLKAHSEYVKLADSYGAAGRPPLSEVFWIQLDPYEAGKASVVINVLMVIGIIGGRRRTVAELLLTYLPFFIFALYTVNPMGSSRLSLNYISGIMLLAVEGAAVLGRLAARVQPRFEHPVRAGAIGVIVVRLATWVWPAFEVPRRTIAPPVMAALWIDKNVPTSRTLFVDENAWPWARYFAPKHKQNRAYGPMNVVTNPEAATGWYIGTGPSNASSAVQFIRPRTRTWNIVAKRAFEAYVQPASSVVMFGAGWHMQEGDHTASWRWSKRRSLMLLGPSEGKMQLRMQFSIPLERMREPVTVTFNLNGTVLARMPITQPDNDVRFVIDAHADKPNMLGIEVSDFFVPARAGSHDTRELALMLWSADWRPL